MWLKHTKNVKISLEILIFLIWKGQVIHWLNLCYLLTMYFPVTHNGLYEEFNYMDNSISEFQQLKVELKNKSMII